MVTTLYKLKDNQYAEHMQDFTHKLSWPSPSEKHNSEMKINRIPSIKTKMLKEWNDSRKKARQLRPFVQRMHKAMKAYKISARQDKGILQATSFKSVFLSITYDKKITPTMTEH